MKENKKTDMVTLPQDYMESLLIAAGERGAKVALETYETQKLKDEEGFRDRRLRNTRLLLKNYKMLRAHCLKAIFTDDTSGDSIDDILYSMQNANSDVYVESIKRSSRRTKIIIHHVDEMLNIYESYCKSSGKSEENRRYDILYYSYFDENKWTIRQMAETFHIDERTVYKDRRKGEEQLSALIFGIDWIK